jgi:hypothetical protein
VPHGPEDVSAEPVALVELGDPGAEVEAREPGAPENQPERAIPREARGEDVRIGQTGIGVEDLVDREVALQDREARRRS